ncbi:MAG: hypothetical protein RR614_16130 [Eubacterium sp.]
MATKYHQISLKESFSDCQDQFIDDDDFKASHPDLIVEKKPILLTKTNQLVMLLL